jgi:hypothetical protein
VNADHQRLTIGHNFLRYKNLKFSERILNTINLCANVITQVILDLLEGYKHQISFLVLWFWILLFEILCIFSKDILFNKISMLVLKLGEKLYTHFVSIKAWHWFSYGIGSTGIPSCLNVISCVNFLSYIMMSETHIMTLTMIILREA